MHVALILRIFETFVQLLPSIFEPKLVIRMKCKSILYVLFFFCSLFIEDIESFRCDDGKTISDALFCNSNYGPIYSDCSDHSDESYGCDRRRCNSGNFGCANRRECKNITGRCDRFADCSDGSDEMRCVQYSQEISREGCDLSNGKYLCRDQSMCIDLKHMCDGECTCFDCSDENNSTCYNYNDSCRLCPHHCLHTPEGALCVCNSSANESTTNTWCKKLEDCTGKHSHCDQSCMRYDSTTWCSCFENFISIPDSKGSDCKTNVWFENLLLYSTVSKIKVLNITSNQVQTISAVEADITSLTAARNYMYYASYEGGKAEIFKIANTSEGTRKVIETDSLITSLAVDWITGNIYFTNKTCISVCTNNGDICIRLECSDAPNYVVLAPTFGLMYYTKKLMYQDVNVIMKANMDGSETVMFVDYSSKNVVSLSIDETKETLYWYDVKTGSGMLYSISFEGLNEQAESFRSRQFILPFTVFEKNVFYKYSENEIQGLKNWQHIHYFRDTETSNINHLYAYNPFLQNVIRFTNPCDAVSCNGVCLLRPFSSTKLLNYTCLCQNHTSKNGTSWCSRPSTKPTRDAESIRNSEVTEQQYVMTTKKKVETTTRQLQIFREETLRQDTSTSLPSNSSIKPMESLRSTNNSFSSSNAPYETSSTDGILLGFVLGAALISAIVGFYVTFRRVYWNRRHQQTSVSELLNLQ